MRTPHPVRGALTALKGFGFKQWFLLCLNVAMIAASIACFAGLRTVEGALVTLSAADRFQGEGEIRFAQMACFLPVGEGKTETEILQFRRTLETALTEQSLEAPENGSLYLDAYSGPAQISITTESGSATVRATGVGGSFFYFHPLTLRAGSYIDEDDVMDDMVVLDEELAWRLYGGVSLTGLTVYLNGQPFVVSGVISRETDFATERAYEGGGVYLSWSALSRLVESAQIDCYEIVMPDPISGYAQSVLEDNFPLGEGDLVENSGRYRVSRLVDVIKHFGERSMRLNGIIYPYWENAARLTEDYAALLLVLTVLFALCPAAFAVTLAVRWLRRGWRTAKTAVPEKVEAAVERRKEARLERAYQKKNGGGGDG